MSAVQKDKPTVISGSQAKVVRAMLLIVDHMPNPFDREGSDAVYAGCPLVQSWPMDLLEKWTRCAGLATRSD
jgi:hypothetical protein